MELSLLVQIFEVCIIPLLGVLTTYFIKWLNAHMDEIRAKKDDLTYQNIRVNIQFHRLKN